jgi:hypothetical protein
MQRPRGYSEDGSGGVVTATLRQPSSLLTPCGWRNIAGEPRLSHRELQIAQGFFNGHDERDPRIFSKERARFR